MQNRVALSEWSPRKQAAESEVQYFSFLCGRNIPTTFSCPTTQPLKGADKPSSKGKQQTDGSFPSKSDCRQVPTLVTPVKGKAQSVDRQAVYSAQCPATRGREMRLHREPRSRVNGE